MKYIIIAIITFLLSAFCIANAQAQGVVSFGPNRAQDSAKTKGQIVAPAYATSDETLFLRSTPSGQLVLDTVESGVAYIAGVGIVINDDTISLDTAYANGIYLMAGDSAITYVTPTQLDSAIVASVWERVNLQYSNRWTNIAYGNGRFVVTGLDDTSVQIIVSEDGVKWYAATVPSGQWYDVEYGNGLFVAVSRGGTPRIMTSPDGSNWTVRTIPGTTFLQTVVYGKGRYVALPWSDSVFYHSIDGINWVKGFCPTGSYRYSIYADSLFVAVASSGNYLITSPDGITWTTRAFPDTGNWYDVCYGGGKYVAVCYNCVPYRIFTSTDAVTWTADSTYNEYTWTNVVWANGYYVAFAGENSPGRTRVMRSKDAVNWELIDGAGDSLKEVHDMIYQNGIIIAVSADGWIMKSGNHQYNSQIGYPITSKDTTMSVAMKAEIPTSGYKWTVTNAIQANFWRSLTFFNSRFVAVARTGTDRVMHTQDGITWTVATAAEANNWEDVAASNDVIIAVARSGTNRIMRSTDGITWTAIASPSANEHMCVTFANGKFVILTNGTQSLVSTDGITWTVGTTPNWTPRAVAGGNGIFAAVGGNGDDVITSTDGLTWTSRTAPHIAGWERITFGSHGFVAVCFSCATYKVMTSPDGITWTGNTAYNTINWYGITYGNNYYMATAYSGVGNRSRVMRSSDGQTWELIPNASDSTNGWYEIAAGNGMFVVTGDNNKVMTSGKIYQQDFQVLKSNMSRESYVPTSTADSRGVIGNVSWDDNYLYIKTSVGWKRSAFATF